MPRKTYNGTDLWIILWRSFKYVEVVDRQSIIASDLGGISDFALLEVLLHKGPLPVNTIAEKVLLTSGSMTTAVNRAVKRGHVTREASDEDGRVVEVHLTSEGRTVIENAYKVHAEKLNKLFRILDADERMQLAALLKKVGLHAEAQSQVS